MWAKRMEKLVDNNIILVILFTVDYACLTSLFQQSNDVFF